jgi:AraC-like DNA-binding protein
MAFEANFNDPVSRRYSDDFDVNLFGTHGYEERPIQFDTPIGHVSGTAWTFRGIRMTYSEAIYNHPAELRWKGDSELITMHFNLVGKISLDNINGHRHFELGNNQHNIFYGKEGSGKIKMDDLQAKQFLVQISKNEFFRIAEDGNDLIKRFAERVANFDNALFSDHNLPIGINIQQCINTILNCPYSSSLKHMFLYSKAIELLVLQAQCFEKTTNKTGTSVKSTYDHDRILFARDYLLKNISKPPSLSGLAKIAGINEYKLKRGFKETFNATVFQYLADTRLEIAKTELQQKNKTVTEIAFDLGYSSVPHFSAAFKKKFGVSPRRSVFTE